MNCSSTVSMASVTILLLAFSQNAWARHSDDRTGFNFGTSFQMSDSTEPSFSTGSQGAPSQSTGQTRVTEPYIGYAFADFLSFGINGTFADYRGNDTVKGSSDGESITTTRSSSLTGGGLYTRLLFGQVMFLELGAGYYERLTVVNTEYVKNLASGGFSGNMSAAKIRAQGAGYRLGGGVEIPIANGFFFTTGYYASFYQLSPSDAPSNVDRSQFFENRHEITFGLANYYN